MIHAANILPREDKEESKQCWDKLAGWGRPGASQLARVRVTGWNGKYYSWMTANSHLSHTITHATGLTTTRPRTVKYSYSHWENFQQNFSFLWFIFCPVCPSLTKYTGPEQILILWFSVLQLKLNTWRLCTIFVQMNCQISSNWPPICSVTVRWQQPSTLPIFLVGI